MIDYHQLVDDDRQKGVFRVNRALMTSQDVYERERKQLFDRCWLYLGHESEVERAGDYVRRTVGGRPLIFLRDADGLVRTFYNTCTHRGATVCRQDSGNAKVFQCFYHAWGFDTRGDLVAVPFPDGYTEGFDRSEYRLGRPPRLDSYRGLYFVNFSAEGETLLEYLDGAAEYIDLVVDQATEGMRIVPGSHRYSVGANWKLMVENSIDGYHAPNLHATYVEFVKDTGGGVRKAALGTGGGVDLGHGHTVIESKAAWAKPIAYWEPMFGDAARPEVEALRAELVNRFGEERAERMADNFRNLLVFPNLIINDVAAITVRRIEPHGPGRHDIEAWALAPVEERPGSARLQRRLDSFLTFLGPGGFASPDDVEALESCQRGFEAGDVDWSDISRGMGRMPTPQDELQIRTFWRAYAGAMQDGSVPDRITGIETPPTAAQVSKAAS